MIAGKREPLLISAPHTQVVDCLVASWYSYAEGRMSSLGVRTRMKEASGLHYKFPFEAVSEATLSGVVTLPQAASCIIPGPRLDTSV